MILVDIPAMSQGFRQSSPEVAQVERQDLLRVASDFGHVLLPEPPCESAGLRRGPGLAALAVCNDPRDALIKQVKTSHVQCDGVERNVLPSSTTRAAGCRHEQGSVDQTACLRHRRVVLQCAGRRTKDHGESPHMLQPNLRELARGSCVLILFTPRLQDSEFLIIPFGPKHWHTKLGFKGPAR